MNTYHSFNVEAACEIGIPEAVMLEHFIYWWRLNAANDRNFKNGNYWTYNKREAIAKLFPYLNARQIQTITEKLKKGGYVVTGSFNKAAFDRTLWYSITEKTFDLYKINHTSIENWQKVKWLFERFGAFNKNVNSSLQDSKVDNTNNFENLPKNDKNCDLSVSSDLTKMLNPFTDLLNGFNKNVNPIPVINNTVINTSINSNTEEEKKERERETRKRENFSDSLEKEEKTIMLGLQQVNVSSLDFPQVENFFVKTFVSSDNMNLNKKGEQLKGILNSNGKSSDLQTISKIVKNYVNWKFGEICKFKENLGLEFEETEILAELCKSMTKHSGSINIHVSRYNDSFESKKPFEKKNYNQNAPKNETFAPKIENTQAPKVESTPVFEEKKAQKEENSANINGYFEFSENGRGKEHNGKVYPLRSSVYVNGKNKVFATRFFDSIGSPTAKMTIDNLKKHFSVRQNVLENPVGKDNDLNGMIIISGAIKEGTSRMITAEDVKKAYGLIQICGNFIIDLRSQGNGLTSNGNMVAMLKMSFDLSINRLDYECGRLHRFGYLKRLEDCENYNLSPYVNGKYYSFLDKSSNDYNPHANPDYLFYSPYFNPRSEMYKTFANEYEVWRTIESAGRGCVESFERRIANAQKTGEKSSNML